MHYGKVTMLYTLCHDFVIIRTINKINTLFPKRSRSKVSILWGSLGVISREVYVPLKENGWFQSQGEQRPFQFHLETQVFVVNFLQRHGPL